MKKKYIIEACIVFVMIVFFVVINIYISKNAKYFSGSVYNRTMNVSSIYDEEGEGQYTISFEAKVEAPGTVAMYLENDRASRYSFTENAAFEMTTEYQSYNVDVNVVLVDENIKNAYLSFLGYGSEVFPTIRNLEITKK